MLNCSIQFSTFSCVFVMHTTTHTIFVYIVRPLTCNKPETNIQYMHSMVRTLLFFFYLYTYIFCETGRPFSVDFSEARMSCLTFNTNNNTFKYTVSKKWLNNSNNIGFKLTKMTYLWHIANIYTILLTLMWLFFQISLGILMHWQIYNVVLLNIR